MNSRCITARRLLMLVVLISFISNRTKAAEVQTWIDRVHISDVFITTETSCQRLFASIRPTDEPLIVKDPAGGCDIILWDCTRQCSPESTKDIVCTNPHLLYRYINGRLADSADIRFTTLPIITLNWSGEVNRQTYIEANLQVLSATHRTDTAMHARIRYRGGTTQWYAKRSFNIKLTDALGQKFDYNMLGMRSDDEWILDGMAPDKIRMRNRVCFDLWNQYNQLPYPTRLNSRNGTIGSFVELVLNGTYYGIYCMTDKVNRQLLGLHKQRTRDAEQPCGLLYQSKEWDITSISTEHADMKASTATRDWNGWQLDYPSSKSGLETWTPMHDLYSFGDTYKYAPGLYSDLFAQHYDIDNLVDFFLHIVVLDLADNGNKNCFVSIRDYKRACQFIFTPWDMDCSLGGWYNGKYYDGHYDLSNIEDLHLMQSEPFAGLWDKNLLNFRQRVALRWQQLKSTTFSTKSIQDQLQHYADIFVTSGAWSREYERWNNTGSQPVSDLYKEIQYIMKWYDQRIMKTDDFLSPFQPQSTNNKSLLYE